MCIGRYKRSWGLKLDCKWWELVLCRWGGVLEVLGRLEKMV